MATLGSFTFITLNGYYKGPDGDIGWHRHGAEEGETAAENAQSDSILLFGRVTYQMMAGYWPTPMARQQNPGVADGMNRAEKIVFSRTLERTDWQPTRIIRDNMIEEVRKMKADSDRNLTLLGSGSILAQLAAQGLIDEYRIMLDPVVIGDGATLFKNIPQMQDLELLHTRTYKSGVLELVYRPIAVQERPQGH